MTVSAWLVAHFAILGVVPEDVAVEFVLTVLVIGGATAVLRWLETRKGDGIWSRLARGIAALAMLGLSAKQPIYARPDETVRVDGQLVQ
jgi:hypothetical protein